MDIISLDMLPENLKTYKTSGLEYPYQTYEYYLKNGYSPQFMQNTLHINNGNGSFSEIAHISGIAATEWSWSPIVSDFDNDGNKDIYITNGILGATNDMDFINFISNENIQKQFSESNKVIKDVTEVLGEIKGTNKQVLSFANQMKSLEKILSNIFVCGSVVSLKYSSNRGVN